MSDGTAPDLIGFRLTLGVKTYEWRIGDTKATHTRALRIATSVPGEPSAEWTEARVLSSIITGEVDGVVLYAAHMEAYAAIAFLGAMQTGEHPDFDVLLDSITGDMDASLEEITKEVAASDPPA